MILLAVILFAALSYAVTSSLRSGGKDSSDDKTNAQISQLLNYFAEMDTAVQRMMTSGNVQDYQLNFRQSSSPQFVFGNYDNTNCTASRCRVFDPAGGGVVGRDLSPYVRDPANAVTNGINTARVFYLAIPGVGTSAPDILFTVSGVSEKFCSNINAQAGYSAGNVYDVGYLLGSGTLMYQFAIPTGTIPDAGYSMSGLPPELANAGTFCTCRTGNGTASTGCSGNVFYPTVWHVVVAR